MIKDTFDAPTWLIVLIALFQIGGWVICIVMLYIVPHKRDPESATGWLLFSFFFPYLGAIFFGLIGNPKLPLERRQLQREINNFVAERVEERAKDPEYAPAFAHHLDERQLPIARLVERLGGLPVFGANQLELLSDYTATIDRIIADIDAAEKYVHLLYYIFADDDNGRKVEAALVRAANRGVVCRVLYDALGNLSYVGKLHQRLEAAGVEVHRVLPLKLLGTQRRRPDLRNHRKIAVIDGVVGYTGSQNLTDPQYKPDVIYEELVVRVCGPVVVQLNMVFLADWYSETDIRVSSEEAEPNGISLEGHVACQVLPSGPAYDTDNIPALFASLLYTAQRYAVLTTPYFIPDASLLHALENAAMRGVEVHVIVSAQGDQFLVSHAQRSYYEELLESGVHIHQVRGPTFIHAKHLSIDDDISVVGSSNFDVRSFRLNLEIVLLSYNCEVVAAQRRIEQSYFARSDELQLEEWLQRSRFQQFVDNTCRLLSALL
jgi:Phosphatidylserine/phosphatidylglycerophosphate/cardiolipin synthases and related enzymes